jgi:hypothetical protein
MRLRPGPTNVFAELQKAFGWRLGRITHAGNAASIRFR